MKNKSSLSQVQHVGLSKPEWLPILTADQLKRYEKLESLIHPKVQHVKATAREIKQVERRLGKLNSENIYRLREIGELLNEMKELLAGQFDTWIDKKFDGSRSTAYNYMNVFRFWDSIIKPRLPKITYREVLKLIVKNPREKKAMNRLLAENLNKIMTARILKNWRPEELELLHHVCESALTREISNFKKILETEGYNSLRTLIKGQLSMKEAA